MATIWTSAAVQTIYLRLTGDVQTGPIAGVMSCTSVDVDNYDNSNYRDVSDLAYPWSLTGGASLNITAAAVKGLMESPADGSAQIVDTIPATGANSYYSYDDRMAHTPPKQELKKRTILLFWSAANGTGSVLASVWADEFVASSLASFEFI